MKLFERWRDRRQIRKAIKYMKSCSGGESSTIKLTPGMKLYPAGLRKEIS